MRKMTFSLSRFPIKYQILIGFVPVLIVLLILAINSLRHFAKADQALAKLSVMQQEAIFFGDIKKDLISLQRNVMVYSYIGYDAVLKNISFIQGTLEENFDKIDFSAKRDTQIAAVFSNMYENYTSYNTNFKRAVNEKSKLNHLYNEKLEPISKKVEISFENIQLFIQQDKDYRLLYYIEKIHLDLFVIKDNLYGFETKPDSKLTIDNRKRFKRINTYLTNVLSNSNEPLFKASVTEFLAQIKEYEAINKAVIKTSQSYIRLVNIVMAGKSSEIQNLIKKLNTLLYDEANSLKTQIKSDVAQSRFHFIILMSIAFIIGLLLPIYIAGSIANPVKDMAKILYELSKGKVDLTIPALNRNDEVGQMAKAADAFKITAQHLEHQTAELEEFAYRTSHDLRSPLVSSIALLGIVKKSVKKQAYERVESCVDLVVESLEKLETLVGDILDLTKTKNAVEPKTSFNIEVAIDEALHKVSYLPHFNRLNIIKNIDIHTDIFIQADRIILIIENLISNAVKYQDTGRADPTIHISCSVEENQLVLSIEDNGLGVPKEYQDQLFTMFKRFHPKASFGSGLGLYMIKKSADIIGGQIYFTDTGMGSKFTLSLPYEPVDTSLGKQY